ncbi:MAG TPA: PCP reductase family protein [Acidobacteriota bacterium]|nr:PCP reductase family protein [Acidobacteriota bacterium]
MKFLCVECDAQMQLQEASSATGDGGKLSIVFECPSCSRQFCMLTNPSETQVVTSLGVRIGSADREPKESKCPFGEMVDRMGLAESPSGLDWTPEASQRLNNIPEFIRPMARKGIEDFARAKGYRRIDLEVLDEARERFGM